MRGLVKRALRWPSSDWDGFWISLGEEAEFWQVHDPSWWQVGRWWALLAALWGGVPVTVITTTGFPMPRRMRAIRWPEEGESPRRRYAGRRS